MLAIAAGTVLLLTLVSAWIKQRLWASQAMICFLVGLACGSWGFGVAELDIINNETHLAIVEQVTRVTLALSVMSAALSLPTGYLRANRRALILVLVPGTMAMWAVSAGIAWSVLDIGVLLALLAGAILTPTDPVLARSIVTGRLASAQVPARTRNLITAESGINDGLALPLVMLPLMLMDMAGAVAQRSLAYLVWEVLGALAAGWVLGKATGALFRYGNARGLAESKSLTATTTALALLTLAAVSLMGADGVLAVFVAGIVLNRAMKERHAASHEHFQDAVDRSFTLPVFILLGMAAPLGEWLALGWPGLLAAFAIVTLRRWPAWLLLQAVAKPYRDRSEASFAGWFGPIGVAALFYGATASRNGAPETLWAFTSLVVVLSIFVHGITATPFTRRHGAQA